MIYLLPSPEGFEHFQGLRRTIRDRKHFLCGGGGHGEF